MNRREFVCSLTVLATLPFTANAQQSTKAPAAVKRLGMVFPGSAKSYPPLITAFSDRLRELGWVEGKNLQVEAGWANGKLEHLGTLMSRVIETNVDVLFTSSTPGAVAAMRATNSVPIVAAPMGDPVGTGLALSLSHPGRNLTGLSTGFSGGFASKWLQLLRESLPRLNSVAVVINPESSLALPLRRELEQTAPTLGITLKFLEVRTASSLALAVRQAHQDSQALLVLPDPITYEHRSRLAALALKHGLPSMYGNLEFVEVGGLMAYGVNFPDLYRRAAEYVDKILRGANPADLPIEQPTKFELVVNLKTAKALNITIPESILLRADEVIR